MDDAASTTAGLPPTGDWRFQPFGCFAESMKPNQGQDKCQCLTAWLTSVCAVPLRRRSLPSRCSLLKTAGLQQSSLLISDHHYSPIHIHPVHRGELARTARELAGRSRCAEATKKNSARFGFSQSHALLLRAKATPGEQNLIRAKQIMAI